jgi:hypothetical protein
MPPPCPWFQRKPCDKSMIASETWRQMGWSFHEALTEKSRDRGRPPVITRATGRRFIRQEKVYKADGEGFLPLFLFRSRLLLISPLTSSVFTLLQLSLVVNIYQSHSKMVKLTSAFIALACAVSSCMASPVVTERAVSATCPRYTSVPLSMTCPLPIQY